MGQISAQHCWANVQSHSRWRMLSSQFSLQRTQLYEGRRKDFLLSSPLVLTLSYMASQKKILCLILLAHFHNHLKMQWLIKFPWCTYTPAWMSIESCANCRTINLSPQWGWSEWGLVVDRWTVNALVWTGACGIYLQEQRGSSCLSALWFVSRVVFLLDIDVRSTTLGIGGKAVSNYKMF